MRRVGAAAVAAVASLSLVAACSSEDEPATAPPAGGATGEVTVPISAMTTRLLDPGAEPHATIEVAPADGTSQRIRMTTESGVHQQIGTQPTQDFSSPELTLDLDARTHTEPTGGYRVEMTIADTSSPDETLGRALEDAAGSGAGLTVAPDGSVTALRLRPAPDSQDIARSAIEQAFYTAVYRMIAFPAEPIGVGAQWTIHQNVQSGIALDQTTTATLTALDGDVATVEFSVDQTPQSPTWTLPGDGGTLDVDRYVMQGTGTARVDIGSPLPTLLDVSVGGEQSYSDPAGTTALHQTTTNSVELSEQ
ncbi:hypothetical protein DW322_15690 [Rhodococcus rhodnii]|uniref:Uncharacterized protein n=1 Tax=Rhodococcus rhodnii TaxID=38312 RepID=A0A6P2CIU9_9NOCA|nr:hypothetical protein DW322_15690 [Rhodococcus rhodnii]